MLPEWDEAITRVWASTQAGELIITQHQNRHLAFGFHTGDDQVSGDGRSAHSGDQHRADILEWGESRHLFFSFRPSLGELGGQGGDMGEHILKVNCFILSKIVEIHNFRLIA